MRTWISAKLALNQKSRSAESTDHCGKRSLWNQKKSLLKRWQTAIRKTLIFKSQFTQSTNFCKEIWNSSSLKRTSMCASSAKWNQAIKKDHMLTLKANTRCTYILSAETFTVKTWTWQSMKLKLVHLVHAISVKSKALTSSAWLVTLGFTDSSAQSLKKNLKIS